MCQWIRGRRLSQIAWHSSLSLATNCVALGRHMTSQCLIFLSLQRALLHAYLEGEDKLVKYLL